jgi:hypothetical protein
VIPRFSRPVWRPGQFTLHIQKAAQQSLATLTLRLHVGVSRRFNAYPGWSICSRRTANIFTLYQNLFSVNCYLHYSCAHLHPIRRSHISLQVIKPLEIQCTWRWLFGADRGNRTLVFCLEGNNSTIELYPHFNKSIF